MILKVILTEDHLMVELLDRDRIIIGTIKGVTFEDSIKIVTCTCDGSYYAFKRLIHRFILEAKHLGINVLELHISTLDDRVRHYVDRYGFERPYGDETYLEWRVR